MQRLRSLHNKARYTQISNDAIDNLPSLEAVGLLATILRHSDDWDFQMSTLIKSKPDLGEQRAYRARHALVEHGYVVQVKFKHSRGGLFWTDIYRAAEPHTAEDLEELRRRYAPGQATTLTTSAGREQAATILWAELTSALGVEQLAPHDEAVDSSTSGNPDAPPVDNSTEEADAFSQVAPDPGFRGSGYPGPGYRGPGNPGSLKEDRGESDQEHPDSGRTEDPTNPEGTPEHWNVACQIVQRFCEQGAFTRIGAYQSQIGQIRTDIAAALAAGYPAEAVEAYLAAKLAIGGKVVFIRNAFTADRLPDITAFTPAAPPEPTGPKWCGQCDPAGRVNPNRRQIIDEASDQLRPCPHCHPSAVSDDG